MITEKQFEEGIQRNVKRTTHYQSGGDGSGGGCDCIGLDIGAIRLMGGKWVWTHGTNYAARNRMQNFRKISSAKELTLNELVYKARKPGEKGYSLPDKYKSSGDLNDYYHVGTVTSVSPLRITHCTSVEGGIKVDTALGKWQYAGWLDQIKKDDGGGGNMKQYKVIGGNLKLRKAPSVNSQVLKLIPNGAIVTGLEEEKDGWIRVEYSGVEGYCMYRFLEPLDEPTYDDDNIGAAIETAFANVYSALDELKAIITSAL